MAAVCGIPQMAFWAPILLLTIIKARYGEFERNRVMISIESVESFLGIELKSLRYVLNEKS